MSEDPEKKIVVDSDWKTQVRQEKEKLQGETSSEASSEPSSQPEPAPVPPAEASPSPGGYALPKPDFTLLISMLATQAFSALGQIPDPASGKIQKHPEVAKHMIDLLGVLEEKTKGNLEAQEKLALESILHELRMVYVAATQGT
ncbi:DUF1844 domain-containing protein [Blastopirellula marina]|uniref:DUF1844 domain-containing protein n=1 Tax=Blastopirellula marina TaxID=124 RepID=A0A2S8GB32_9BACT|nr:DUF1844 domain-containing protein [Blastopirellula marina]PQO41666.1 DUF1844 domain-containing protein [Blastopirellula marina]PTL46109.1 DUF1844 domain-containing protein [Blastopirellula marina]